MEIKHPKLLQFYARTLPPIFFIYIAVISLTDWGGDAFAIDMIATSIPIWPGIIYTIGVILFLLYLVLVYWFLPPLIYPSANDTWLKHIFSQLFTAITVGLGPVILYWLTTDKWFSKFIEENKNN